MKSFHRRVNCPTERRESFGQLIKSLRRLSIPSLPEKGDTFFTQNWVLGGKTVTRILTGGDPFNGKHSRPSRSTQAQNQNPGASSSSSNLGDLGANLLVELLMHFPLVALIWGFILHKRQKNASKVRKLDSGEVVNRVETRRIDTSPYLQDGKVVKPRPGWESMEEYYVVKRMQKRLRKRERKIQREKERREREELGLFFPGRR